MIEHHGSQCGFCTPGIVMSLFALHQSAERPVARDAVLDALAGNLCRCTGYRPIVDAALQACAAAPPREPSAAEIEDLAALDDRCDLMAGDEHTFFAAPASEAALSDLYLRHPDAWLVAGATDLGLAVTKALAEPRKVIWLGRVRELAEIERTERELTLGATVSQAQAMPLLAAIDPDLGEIMRRFGSPQVRASGTIGGNIANGSPIGDLAPCLIALGARLELARDAKRRTLPLEDFFLGYKRQDRGPGEYVRRVQVPLLAAARALPRLQAVEADGRGHLRRAWSIQARDRRTQDHGRAHRLRRHGRRAGARARLRGGARRRKPRRPGHLDAEPSTRWPTTSRRSAIIAPVPPTGRAALRNLLLKALLEIAGTPEQSTRLRPSREQHHAG